MWACCHCLAVSILLRLGHRTIAQLMAFQYGRSDTSAKVHISSIPTILQRKDANVGVRFSRTGRAGVAPSGMALEGNNTSLQALRNVQGGNGTHHSATLLICIAHVGSDSALDGSSRITSARAGAATSHARPDATEAV